MDPYTPSSSLLSAGRIGQARWAEALEAHGAVDPSRIVNLYHAYAPGLGLNPDLALAQACEETGWFTSRRWLEQRNPCGLGIVADDTPGVVFDTQKKGIVAHLHHLCCYAYSAADCPAWHPDTPDFRHAFHDGQPAISHIQDSTRQWATKPAYISRILAIANALLTAPDAPGQATGGTMPLTIREAIIPAANIKSNRPGTKLQGGKPRFITIHETGNTDAGANAEMHRRFTHGANGWGGGGHPARTVNGVFEPEYEGVSFHYCVDDREAVHLLPDDEIGYHAGDGLGKDSGGATSLGIETCVNSDGNFPKALANLAQLVAVLMQRHGIPLANVVQHNHWSGKACPANMRANNEAKWKGLIAAIKVTTTGATPPAEDKATWKTFLRDGRAIVEVDMGGVATGIAGVNIQDLGVSVYNAQGDTYDRTIRDNKPLPWKRRG